MQMTPATQFEAATASGKADKKGSVARFLKALEASNAKAMTRAGGMSVMALTLAACGGGGGTEATTVVPTTPVAPPPPTAFMLNSAQLNGVISLRSAVDGISNFINNELAALTTATNTTATPAVVDNVARVSAQNAVAGLTSGASAVDTILAADAIERLVLANRDAIARDFAQILGMQVSDILNTAANIGTAVAAGLPRPTTLSAVENAIFDIIVAAQTNGEIFETLLGLTRLQFPNLNLPLLGTYAGPTVPTNATLADLIAAAQASVAAVSALAGPAVAKVAEALSLAASTFPPLTLGADNVGGTSGNDVVNGTTATFNGNDTINGGAGVDTLNITQADPSAATGASIADALFANVRGIENVRFSATSLLSPAQAAGDITLGTNAAAAGVRSLVLLGNGGDANVAAFVGDLTITGNSGVNVVNVSLASAGTKTLSLGTEASVFDVVFIAPNTAAVGAIQVNFISSTVGNMTDENVTVVGPNGSVIVNDETTIISATNNASVFNVVGIGANGQPDPLQNRGTFGHIFLGSASGETINVALAVDGQTLTGDFYVNAGGGNDTLLGGAGNDFFVGGAGDDVITLTQFGNDSAIGGAGNDTITSGLGADNLNGGDGADLIAAGDGNNTVVGGTGADTISAGGGNDTIDGGDGDDMITAGGGSNTVLGGLGSDNITTGAGNDSIDGGEGNDTITAGGGNDTIIGGLGDDLITALGVGVLNVNAGDGNDRVAVDNLSSSDTLAGGVGTDTLSVDQIGAGSLTNVTGFEILEISASSTANLAEASGFTIVGSSATNGAVTFTNAGANVTTLNLVDNAVAGNEQNVSFSRATNGNDTLAINRTALSAVDQLVQIRNENTVIYNSGNAVPFGATTLPQTNTQTLDVEDLTSLTITGNANTVINLVDNNNLTPLALATVNATGFGNYVNTVSTVTTATTLTVNASASTVALTFTGGTNTGLTTFTSGSGNDVLNAGSGAVNFSGGAGNDTLTGSGLNDTLDGGFGNDILNGGVGDDVLVGGRGADTINGGAGNNTYSVGDILGGNTEGLTLGLGGTGIIGAEVTGQRVDLTTNTAEYLYNGLSLALQPVVDTLINIQNVIGSNGGDAIIGSASANRLDGGAGADTITGGAGNDTIVGGADNDQITLGSGNDTVVFNSLIGSDIITDYNVAGDAIQIDNSIFVEVGADGMLSEAQFLSVASAAALNGGAVGTSIDSQALIYLQNTGELFYNADGATAGGLQLIATFTGAPLLVAGMNGEFTVI